MLILVYCGVNEQLVSRDTGQKRKNPQRGSGATPGVLQITKQHSNPNDDGNSCESSHGGVDCTFGTDGTSFVTAPLADTRTIGKSPTFTGEHKDWPEWSFQCTAHMGSTNPKSFDARRWAAMEEDRITVAAMVKQNFEEHNRQLYLPWHSCAKEVPW